MYIEDERFKENIDKYAEGIPEYISEVINILSLAKF